MQKRQSSTRGFKRTSSLLSGDIRKVAETRGFAVARLLTHWDEIAGERIAAIARPVEVSYGARGFGATLTVLTTGPQAPVVEMEKDRLRDRVNATYGYNAIARIRITQTAATGFAEAQAHFAGATHKTQQAEAPETGAQARQMVDRVGNADLRAALESLGRNVLTKQHSNKKGTT